MIDIIVQRGGDIDGGEISDPLLSNVAVALARGTYEIDSNATAKIIKVDVNYRSGVTTGQMARLLDSVQGVNYLGKITSVTAGVDGLVHKLSLEIEVPL